MDESSTRVYERKTKILLAQQGRREGWRPRPAQGALRPAWKPLVCGCRVVQVRTLVREMDESSTRVYERKAKKFKYYRADGRAGDRVRRGVRRGRPGSPLCAVEGVAQAGALVREMDESSTRDYERKAKKFQCYRADGRAGEGGWRGARRVQRVAWKPFVCGRRGRTGMKRWSERWTRVLRETTRDRRIILLVVVTK